MEKRILFILTGLLSGAGISLFVFYNLYNHFPNFLNGSLLLLAGGFSGAIQLWLFYSISQWLTHIIPLEKRFSLRFGLDFIINAILGVAYSSTFFLVIAKLASNALILENWEVYKESFLILWILELILVIIYNIIMLGYYSYNHYAEGQITDLIQSRKQLKLQFDTLKSQLSPHFLFNSLNTISSLIHKDNERAEEFIRRLAETYQYVLKTHQNQLIPIEKEVEFVRAYYYLLIVRYNEGLKLNIDIPDKILRSYVPPLTIQILIENAIKHNVFSKDDPLYIRIEVFDHNKLRILNNKTRPPHIVNSTKVGLSNLKRRYNYFTNHRIEILDEQDFEVIIPIIEKENKTLAA